MKRLNIYLPLELKEKAKKQHINLSQFVSDMLERELLRIDEAEKKLGSDDE